MHLQKLQIIGHIHKKGSMRDVKKKLYLAMQNVNILKACVSMLALHVHLRLAN